MDAEITPEHLRLLNIIQDRFIIPDQVKPGLNYLTTMQVYRRIQSIFPADYHPSDIYQVLQQLNVKVMPLDSDRFVWVLEFRDVVS